MTETLTGPKPITDPKPVTEPADLPYASPDDLLTLQASVPEGDVIIEVDGKPFKVHIKGVELTDQLLDMMQTTESVQRHQMPVPLPPGDRSGEKQFKPSKNEIATAVLLSVIVTEPKMHYNQWLIFGRRNSFAAADLAAQANKLLGLTFDEEEETLTGVTAAKEALEEDPFPVQGAPDVSEAVSPAPLGDAETDTAGTV